MIDLKNFFFELKVYPSTKSPDFTNMPAPAGDATAFVRNHLTGLTHTRTAGGIDAIVLTVIASSEEMMKAIRNGWISPHMIVSLRWGYLNDVETDIIYGHCVKPGIDFGDEITVTVNTYFLLKASGLAEHSFEGDFETVINDFAKKHDVIGVDLSRVPSDIKKRRISRNFDPKSNFSFEIARLAADVGCYVDSVYEHNRMKLIFYPVMEDPPQTPDLKFVYRGPVDLIAAIPRMPIFEISGEISFIVQPADLVFFDRSVTSEKTIKVDQSERATFIDDIIKGTDVQETNEPSSEPIELPVPSAADNLTLRERMLREKMAHNPSITTIPYPNLGLKSSIEVRNTVFYDGFWRARESAVDCMSKQMVIELQRWGP